MTQIQIKDLTFDKFINESQIQEAVRKVADQIKLDYASNDQPPLLVGILNGSFMFAADLMKNLEPLPCEIAFVKVSSYEGTSSTGQVKTVLGIDSQVVKGRDIIVVEDIVDTGGTVVELSNIFAAMQPNSFKICTMFLKPDKYKKDIPLDYVAMEIPDDFVIGYGLDLNGLARNYRDLYTLSKD